MPRSRVVLLLLALAALIALAAVLTWTFRAPPRPYPVSDAVAQPAGDARSAPADQPPVPVVVGEVVSAVDEARLALPGSGRAARSVTLYPAAAGEVAQVDFRPGQRVEAGHVLLRLDDRTQRLALDTATARLEQARKLLARYEATRGTGAVPGSLIDEAASTVQLARIEQQQAREALADRVLRAPFSGVVGLAQVEPGDRIALDTAITTLDDRRSIEVDFDVPEAYAARVQAGQTIAVSNPAFSGRSFEGRISALDSRVDARTRTLRARANVPNTEDLLRPGMSFQVQLALPGQPFPAVPELALQWGREGALVWAVRAGRAEQVPVRSVRRVEGRVLVEGALEPGEQVVVEGVQRLRPGRRVSVEGDARGGSADAAAAGASGRAEAGTNGASSAQGAVGSGGRNGTAP
ncbi:efflux RND transporter periplasmic adaptor subunit [Ramlibacter sp. AN1015]|uniref:efflux RND transporter periplasmic adaptor subunit n=1 Tax=Ramlibacter sp. AN1015 TaxID=3133428 RepID=UPI0030BC3D9E